MSVGRKKLSVCQNNVAAFSCCCKTSLGYIEIRIKNVSVAHRLTFLNFGVDRFFLLPVFISSVLGGYHQGGTFMPEEMAPPKI